MNILVFNCGSSSLKYRLIAFPSETEIAAGEAQRVGPATAESSRIYHRVGRGDQKVHYADMPNHGAAFREVMQLLKAADLEPDALGHRTVHGGTRFTQPTRMNPEAVQELEALNNLAPLHNPPTLNLMHSCSMQYPDLPQVAVFDTAFHSTIPEEAYTYAIPEKLRKRHGLRKYGFHGTSHRFVVEEAARILNRPLHTLNAVSCHLGSGGASLCAVKHGRSIDNTMGFSPLQGLIMSTRCGDIDPALTLSLLISEKDGETAVEKVLNTRSGVLGLSGTSGDIRDILTAEDPDESVRNTADAYIWRIRKYLGAYLTLVGQPDAIIFTDTVGEQVPDVREKVCQGFSCFGLQLDTEKNRAASALPCDMAAPESRMHILVIQTNEELAIARETYQLLQQEQQNDCPGKESDYAKLNT